MQQAPKPVAPLLRKVMVCVDESDAAEKAFRKAASLVQGGEGEVIVLHVAEIMEPKLNALSLLNPLEDNMQFINKIEQREKAQEIKKKYETLFDEVPTVKTLFCAVCYRCLTSLRKQERFTFVNLEYPSAREGICKQVDEFGDLDLLVLGSRGAGLLTR